MEEKKVPVKGKGTFHIYGSKGVVSIQSKIWRDSAFPFGDKDKLTVVVDKDTVTITRKKDDRQTTL